ncbi:MAG: hypothetical protein M1383_03335 [Patescibacteria group bacterium]|nr:hypothetical protein [Patescibacteria group bacterium]
MSKISKIGATGILAALVVAVVAFSVPIAKAQYYDNDYGYGGYGMGGYGGYGMGGYGMGYNPISQWIVLSGLFNPYSFGGYY